MTKSTRQRKLLFWSEAVELMIEAKIIEGEWSVGADAELTEIIIPAGSITADKHGRFKRSDVCRLIGWAQMDKGE